MNNKYGTKQSLMIYAVSAFTMLPIWSISGLILGVTLLLMTKGSWILFFIGLLIPLGIVLFNARRRIEKVELSLDYMQKSILNTRSDYYYYNKDNAISINVDEELICIIKANDKNHLLQDTLNIKIDKVNSLQSTQAGHTEYSSEGSDIVFLVNDMRNTLQSRVQANKKTGLILYLDDVMQPEIFIKMDHNDARRWSFLLETLMSKKLEKQKHAIFYPTDSLELIKK